MPPSSSSSLLLLSSSSSIHGIRFILLLSFVLTVVFSIRSSATLEILWFGSHDAEDEVMIAPLQIPLDPTNKPNASIGRTGVKVTPATFSEIPNSRFQNTTTTTTTAATATATVAKTTTVTMTTTITASSSSCSTSECWEKLAESLGLVRAFPDRHDKRWIVQGRKSKNHDTNSILIDRAANNRTYSHAGILYVKNFKAASTTTAGVALRLSHRLLVSSTTTTTTTTTTFSNHSTTSNISGRAGSTSQQKQQQQQAWVYAHHSPGVTYRDRHPTRSFLFSSVRDPASRALSRIFYTQVSFWGVDRHDDQQILKFLRDTNPQFGSVQHFGGGYQVWFLSTEGDRLPRSWGGKQPTKVQRPDDIVAAIQQIVDEYDFLLVAERLDESIVVLSMLLNVSLDDVLVQNAKESTTSSWYYFKQRKSQWCKRPVRVIRSPSVTAHLESDEWLAKNYGDYLLHAAANLSLDATIERLGRDRVDKALQVYRSLQDQVVQECRNQTIYHCSAAGKPQTELSNKNCYADDSGCGYPCVDNLLSGLPDPKTARVF